MEQSSYIVFSERVHTLPRTCKPIEGDGWEGTRDRHDFQNRDFARDLDPNAKMRLSATVGKTG